ncbi:O-antigen ligase family protein [Paenibacillus sp. JSM ZJ436]|uniref:O-antigen ligase family protein n=1 Tax=Paenibacillus sp. JSM ZJ436 TaxID=3376190 RepID=UPI0037CAF073
MSPEVRRVVDWSFQSYSEFSLIMLSPQSVSLLLLIPTLNNIKHINPKVKTLLKVVMVALLYGFLVGFMKYGMSSIYELLNLFIPFLILIYANVSYIEDSIKDFWMRSYACLAVIVSIYGIFQYITLPPWDHFWMINTDMNSIGLPEAQKFRLYSLLNSPGPAGMFLGFALPVMLVQRKWRVFGILGVMIVAFALLLTLVRVGWISCLVMFFVYFLCSQFRKKIGLLMLMVIMGIAYVSILPILPGADNVSARFNTFESLEEDHSFNDRLNFAKYIVPELLKNPIGNGIGSSGVGVKLTQSTNTLAVFDNGYLNLLYVFGLPFGLAMISVLIYMFIILVKANRHEKKYTPISIAALGAIFFLLLGSNVLSGLSGIILFLLISLSLTKNPLRKESM